MLRSITAIGLGLMLALSGYAQAGSSRDEKTSAPQKTETAPHRFFHLKFVVQELDNERVINSRAYNLVMQEGGVASVRAGEKVPVTTTSGPNAQWQQIDIGVSVDCRNLQVTGNDISVGLKVDISSVIEAQGENMPSGSLPIIRNNQWESRIVVPLKQSSVLFSSDDPASKRRMQMQLTVTPIS